MKKQERHSCPYCDTEIVYKDEQGRFWALQHGVVDCMDIIKVNKNSFRDALKKTQEELAERDEELFVAKQEITKLVETISNIAECSKLVTKMKKDTDLKVNSFLKESLGELWPGGLVAKKPEGGIIDYLSKKVE